MNTNLRNAEIFRLLKMNGSFLNQIEFIKKKYLSTPLFLKIFALFAFFAFLDFHSFHVCTQCESSLDAHRKHEKPKAQENHEKHFFKNFMETNCILRWKTKIFGYKPKNNKIFTITKIKSRIRKTCPNLRKLFYLQGKFRIQTLDTLIR